MAGGGSGGSAAGTGGTGTSNACPVDLVGFATLRGGTTGGGTTAPTTVRTQAELRTCATATGPRVCRVQGTLTFNPFEEIRVASDKTIIGAGRTRRSCSAASSSRRHSQRHHPQPHHPRQLIEGSTTRAATTAAIATASRWTPPTTSGSITCTSTTSATA
jgi:hypothetical protein